MIQSEIFDVIKNKDEIRTIDDVYLIADNEGTNSFQILNILFKINDNFWIIGIDHTFDEIELSIKPQLHKSFKENKTLNTLSHLKGLEIGTMFAIINERGYTDGLKLTLYDHSPSRLGTNPFFGVLTIIAMTSGLYYELTQTGIDTYLI